MKITKVTMTGADDNTDQMDLFKLSRKYPFVEWGILISRSSMGRNRFPSNDWMVRLRELTEMTDETICLSGHLCGSVVREFLLGQPDAFDEMGRNVEMFDRFQINTHGQKHKYSLSGVQMILRQYPDKEFIFQYDNLNAEILKSLMATESNCSTLFDLSHGAGKLPSEWPKPIEEIACGYAGGLSPENVVDQIAKISEAVGGSQEIWIDAETHVRSEDDQLFDLVKVEAFLKASEPFIL